MSRTTRSCLEPLVLAALSVAGSVGATLAAPAAEEPRYLGPLAQRDYQPLMLPLLSPPFEAPATSPPGRFRLVTTLAESNSILDSDDDEPSRIFGDVETSLLTLDLRRGLSKRVEAGVVLPIVYRWGGFLDPPIEWVERLVNEFNPSREAIEDHRIDLSYVRRQEEIFAVDDARLGIGDVSLFVRAAIVERQDRALTLGAHLELATGDEEELFGNGSTDAAISASFTERLGRWAIHAGGSVVFPGGFLDESDVELKSFYSAMIAGERRVGLRSSIVGQLGYHESPYSRADLLEFEQDLYEFAIAFAHRLENGTVIKIGGIENFTVRPAADFTIVLSAEKIF